MGWLQTKCSVDDQQKAWIEASSRWLMNELRFPPKSVTVVLPTPEFFPDAYTDEESDVRKLMDRVCSYMFVDPDRVSLEIQPDESDAVRDHLPFFESSTRGAAGQFHGGAEKFKISISAACLREPTSLVAVIAHELGHVLLLGDQKISSENQNHEPLTDLLTIFLGLGIFTANSAFRFTQWQGGFKQGWSARQLGYLSEAMFGYSLALFAWLREETRPPEWSKFLEGDARHYFKAALKYLAKNPPPAFASQSRSQEPAGR
jgi:hypothetical protein